jgi:hypothetical protein
MTIIRKNDLPFRKRQIFLSSSEGNAFVLMGFAKQIDEQLCRTKEEIDNRRERMMAGDYENLIQVFDDEYGQWFDLIDDRE